jgi:metallophosphoesterase (TIGR00282 family)
MKLLFIGDINGRSGRDVVRAHVPQLRATHGLDLVIANVDNISHGRGPTPATLKEMADAQIDLFTGGDHIWDNREMLAHLDREPHILRPLNYPINTPGKGFHVLTVNAKRVLVVHALGRVFMQAHSDNPFQAIDALLQKHILGQTIDAIILDFHAEATSEKNAMGLYLDGRVSVVVGTHTHIPTADARVLPKGTAYCTDIGMSGDYNSVIGADPMIPIAKFSTGMAFDRMKPAEGIGTLSGVIVEIDDATGLARQIELIRVGATW